MFSMKKDFLHFNDKLYLLKKVLREEHNPIIDSWKEHLRADLVLRKDGLLYFLEEVVELEIIP